MNSNKKQKIKKPKRKSDFFYTFTKITAGPAVLLWLRPKAIYQGVTTKKDYKGALICANHEETIDPLILQCIFWNKKINFLAMKELFEQKSKRFFFSRVRCIPVDRENFSISSLHAVCDELKLGNNVIIFPEGKMHAREHELLQFKGGAPLIAYLSGAKVVPTYIVPKGKWYERRKVVFGDPIDIRKECKAPSMAQINEASELIKNQVLKLKSFYEAKEKKQ